MRVVFDTNVIFAALYSRQGASHALLNLVGEADLQPCLSVAMLFEYEEVLKSRSELLGLTHKDIEDVLAYFARVADHIKVFYLWRPCLHDPNDDMILETAVAGKADFIVTHNVRDFTGAERFGVRIVTPGWLLKNMGGSK